MARIELGDKVKDTITGFAGVVIAKTQWLHGCERITIQPEKLHEGKPVETQSFDEPQLEVVKKKKIQEGQHNTGGPRPEPQRR